jgi:hypothetical protein
MANAITQDTAHAVDAVAAMPSQYVDAELMTAVIQTIGERAQLVEDALWALLTQSLPSQAATVGAQLDKWGALVGQARLGGDYPAGESDALYRAKLAAAAVRNRSAGTNADLLQVLTLLIGSNLTLAILMDTPPAAFTMHLVVTTALTAAEKQSVATFITAARGAGIGVTASTYNTVVFGWDDGSGSTPWIGPWGSDWADFFMP